MYLFFKVQNCRRQQKVIVECDLLHRGHYPHHYDTHHPRVGNVVARERWMELLGLHCSLLRRACPHPSHFGFLRLLRRQAVRPPEFRHAVSASLFMCPYWLLCVARHLISYGADCLFLLNALKYCCFRWIKVTNPKFGSKVVSFVTETFRDLTCGRGGKFAVAASGASLQSTSEGDGHSSSTFEALLRADNRSTSNQCRRILAKISPPPEAR